MSTALSVDGLSQALDATGELIAAVKDDQWSNPTPCPGWTVRTLVNHLVSGNRMFAGILRGDPPPELENLRRMRDVDQLGDDPLKAYREAGDALLAAFSQPGVLDRVFQAPVGTVPGAVMLHLRLTEILVHGWDLAQATGQPARLPDDLAEQELVFAQSVAAPDVPRTGHPFGPAQPVAADASAINRLAAYLGRPIITSLTEADRA